MPHQHVLQYIPDVVKDERINIAIAVVQDGLETAFVLTDRWDRVQAFVGHDITLMKTLTLDQTPEFENYSDYPSSLVWSEGKASLQPFDECVKDAVDRYLK